MFLASVWTMTHGYFVCMGGFTLREKDRPDVRLNPDQFLFLLDKKYIDIPDITLKEIEDKSKASWFSKTIAIFQTGWFAMQCIARRPQQLPITKLELLTLALVATNWTVYVFCWHKPANVSCPVPIGLREGACMSSEDRPCEEEIDGGFGNVLWISGRFIKGFFYGEFRVKGGSRVDEKPQWFVDVMWPFFQPSPVLSMKQIITTLRITAGLGVAFGAIHCIAWTFQFPSSAERNLWRICSVVLMVVPATFVPGYWCSNFVWSDGKSTTLRVFVWHLVVLLYGVAYSCARTAMAIEAFISLRALPPGAYQAVQWTTFIPHAA